MRKQRRAITRTLLIRGVPAVLFACALVLGPSASAAQSGISGAVENGTTGKPVAGLEVTLALFTQQGDQTTRTATTDAKGGFTFPDVPSDAVGYQVSASFDGATYRTPGASLSAGQPARADLTVYDTTTDPKAVAQTDWIVWVDREGDGAAIQNDFNWDNRAKTAYVGEQEGGPVVSVSLEPGATNLQFLGTFLETPGDVQGDTYVSTAPIVPGASTATLRYSVASLDELTFAASLPTTSFQLFVPQDLGVRPGPGLRLAGTTTDQNVTYQVYAANDLARGDTLTATVTGVASSNGNDNAITYALVGVAVLAAIAIAVFWILGRRRSARGRRPAARRPSAPQKVKGVAPGKAAAHRTTPARLGGNGSTGAIEEIDDEEVDLLIDEIAALDLSYEKGLLDERTYKRLRVAAKDRLLRARGARARGGTAR